MTQFDNIVVTPVYGPLSTNKYPPVSGVHNLGTLTGQHPTPQQFYPYQSPPYSADNTNSRHQYIRSQAYTNHQLACQRYLAKLSTPSSFQDYSSNKQHSTSTHMNYIVPIQSSMYVNIRKSNAIGKSAYKVGLPLAEPITTKNYYPSGVRSSLRRARSGGCTAPKKKGSIYNTSLTNGHVCACGSLGGGRSTY
jgi:transcription initiation factor TFIID subunit TAF12